jgi:hypothetical protein
MKFFALLAVVCLFGCGNLSYPCGLSCDNDSHLCTCEPHHGSTEQFWIHDAYAVRFFTCGCKYTRSAGSTSGAPIPSDPSLGECYAIAVGSVNPPYDCEMSRSQYSGYEPCIRIIEMGGSVACGDPR